MGRRRRVAAVARVDRHNVMSVKFLHGKKAKRAIGAQVRRDRKVAR